VLLHWLPFTFYTDREELYRDYPELACEDIRQALAFAAFASDMVND
jgi:uncharacterized protein (DUF433 family)